MSFAALGLVPALVRAAADQTYTEPTAIQKALIPWVLRGHDVLATAQTGSGKTAAYALPLLQAWWQAQCADDADHRPARPWGGALVLVPTRELAMQVADTLRLLARSLPAAPKVVVAYGGVSVNPQMMALRGGADVVVATPGRLLDLVDHGALHLGGVGCLVLDEADRLLDLGFVQEMQRLLALLPATRQSVLLSATFAPEVQALAAAWLRQPQRVAVQADPQLAPDITQRALVVSEEARSPLLRHLIADEGWAQVMVFVATQYATELVASKLTRHGIDAAALHGKLSQGRRTEVLAAFKAGRLRVLVATDVASRGIDVAQLPAVINYDLPRSADDHTHRIGRTGRAGLSGLAISFVTPQAEAHFRLIEKRQGLRIPRERLAGFAPPEGAASGLPEGPPPAGPGAHTHPSGGLDPQGGVKGRRKSKKDKLREAAARPEAQGKP